ncbi:MAG TPA: TylF/MycF/NovP-related O-methyltransferase [Phnomibacter sp.]|nr:TylF/MycF/NovP-related O-methyltransferase [Phnomibacter sp.]
MIKKIIRKLIKDYKHYRLNEDLNKIYEQVKDHTMIDPALLHDNLKLIDSVSDIAGDIAECGVWKGGMSAAMAIRDQQQRHFYLFDSFEGLPIATAADGKEAAAYQTGKMGFPKYYNNCKTDESSAIEIMRKTGKPFSTIKGWFEYTMPVFTESDSLAVLRLDGDWYESTRTALTYLYPKVAKGGLVIIDDYHTWDGCTRAIHDYLSEIQSISRINITPNGVAFWIKRD